MRRKYYVGYVSDNWTIIELPDNSKKALMRCKCGYENWIWISNISSHKSKGCWDCSKRTGAEKTFKAVVGQARSRGISWEIDYEDWFRLSQEDCTYCNASPSNYMNIYKFRYNGIDRVNNDEGYNLNNCVPCCRTCNTAKSNMTMEEFLDWIGRIHAWSIRQSSVAV